MAQVKFKSFHDNYSDIVQNLYNHERCWPLKHKNWALICHKSILKKCKAIQNTLVLFTNILKIKKNSIHSIVINFYHSCTQNTLWKYISKHVSTLSQVFWNIYCLWHVKFMDYKSILEFALHVYDTHRTKQHPVDCIWNNNITKIILSPSDFNPILIFIVFRFGIMMIFWGDSQYIDKLHLRTIISPSNGMFTKFKHRVSIPHNCSLFYKSAIYRIYNKNNLYHTGRHVHLRVKFNTTQGVAAICIGIWIAICVN